LAGAIPNLRADFARGPCGKMVPSKLWLARG
jgi:hypothetical protein